MVSTECQFLLFAYFMVIFIAAVLFFFMCKKAFFSSQNIISITEVGSGVQNCNIAQFYMYVCED